MKRAKHIYKKIVFRIDVNAFNRLSEIRDDYGFKSNYEIMKYLIPLFLQVADPIRGKVDEGAEPIPEEIESMFADCFNTGRDFDFIRPKRNLNKPHSAPKTIAFKKVVARIDEATSVRLNAIAVKYGFRSAYEVAQYIAACFLRVADPEIIEEPEPVRNETEAMFYGYSEADRQFDFVKPKRKASNYDLNTFAAR